MCALFHARYLSVEGLLHQKRHGVHETPRPLRRRRSRRAPPCWLGSCVSARFAPTAPPTAFAPCSRGRVEDVFGVGAHKRRRAVPCWELLVGHALAQGREQRLPEAGHVGHRLLRQRAHEGQQRRVADAHCTAARVAVVRLQRREACLAPIPRGPYRRQCCVARRATKVTCLDQHWRQARSAKGGQAILRAVSRMASHASPMATALLSAKVNTAEWTAARRGATRSAGPSGP